MPFSVILGFQPRSKSKNLQFAGHHWKADWDIGDWGAARKDEIHGGGYAGLLEITSLTTHLFVAFIKKYGQLRSHF